jgi:hypothetical protein
MYYRTKDILVRIIKYISCQYEFSMRHAVCLDMELLLAHT